MRLRSAAVVLGLLAGVAFGTGGTAAANSGGAGCNAVCAQAKVHSPGEAISLSVHWRRYPYSRQSNAAAIDRWGTTERQCTGYAAWALNAMGVDFGLRDRGANGRTVEFLAAGEWARAARRGGWKVSHQAVVGSIAQWHANETSRWRVGTTRHSATAGADGHVGVVSEVFSDGTVMLRQYNADRPSRSYSVMRVKAPRYLYVGVK